MSAKPKGSKIGTMSVGALTLVFVGLYFVLRALPDAECGFLHYEEVVNADGEIEFCATNHAGFLDLTRLKYPVEMTLSSEGSVNPGIAEVMQLELLTSGGMGIAPHELAITHTEKMHVMVIDESLQDYHHLHPTPVGLDGEYTFQFEPEFGGEYQVFTEIVPIRTRRQVIGTGRIEVEGVAPVLSFERVTEWEAYGLHFSLEGVPDRLKTGRDYELTLRVEDQVSGLSAELQEIMGARGHMVAFDGERKGFAHMHPIQSIAIAQASLSPVPPSIEKTQDLSFLFNVPNAGWYRLFAQVKVSGEEVFGRFDLFVE